MVDSNTCWKWLLRTSSYHGAATNYDCSILNQCNNNKDKKMIKIILIRILKLRIKIIFMSSNKKNKNNRNKNNKNNKCYYFS